MPSFSEACPNSTPFSRALARVLQEGRFTALEMAEVAGCSDRHIQKVAAGQGALSEEKASLLSRWLCSHGELRPARTFLCPGYAIVEVQHGQADGCVQDESVRIVRAAADIDENHRGRDADGIAHAISALRTVLADLEAEAAHI